MLHVSVRVGIHPKEPNLFWTTGGNISARYERTKVSATPPSSSN